MRRGSLSLLPLLLPSIIGKYWLMFFCPRCCTCCPPTGCLDPERGVRAGGNDCRSPAIVVVFNCSVH